jgi:hypothetical protein
MWSDEQLNNAVEVLWSASKYGDVTKVVDNQKEPVETYVIVNSVAYTDPLYLKALDKLLSDHRLEQTGKEMDRLCFGRPGGDDRESLKAI